MDVVTGAFSFTGRYVAACLLERGREVRTLTRRPQAESPFSARVRAYPLDFADAAGLTESLRGADTLYNTYWLRYPEGGVGFDAALANSAQLFAAAQRAGVRRVVQLSVSNADPASPYPYFSGKAAVESALEATGLSRAVVRPTLVFGEGEVLVNNVAWLLRRLPLFFLPGRGCRVQPIAARELAEICVQAGLGEADTVVDAAGPDVLTFEELVRLVHAAVGSRARLAHAGPRTGLALAEAFRLVTRRTLVTRDELAALGDDLLTSSRPPLGAERIADWIAASAQHLGRHLATGSERPWQTAAKAK